MSAEPASGSSSLLDDALAIGLRKGPNCSVDRLYQYRPDLAAELAEALTADVTATSISAALKRRGVEISAETLQRHRRAACACP